MRSAVQNDGFFWTFEITVKMAFANELEFEAHLRCIVESRITSENPGIFALQYKTAGDIVIVRDEGVPTLFFLDVKYFRLSKGRIGFGNRYGEGLQPEILMKRPMYLEKHFRWLSGATSMRAMDTGS